VETSLKLQGFVYTIQTLPILGRVDLAAVFFDAAKWRDERLLFGECCVLHAVCTGHTDDGARGLCYRTLLQDASPLSLLTSPSIRPSRRRQLL
jgi:hypothetical protein